MHARLCNYSVDCQWCLGRSTPFLFWSIHTLFTALKWCGSTKTKKGVDRQRHHWRSTLYNSKVAYLGICASKATVEVYKYTSKVSITLLKKAWNHYLTSLLSSIPNVLKGFYFIKLCTNLLVWYLKVHSPQENFWKNMADIFFSHE